MGLFPGGRGGSIAKIEFTTQLPANVQSWFWFQSTRMREMIGKSVGSNPDFAGIDIFV